MDSTNSNSFNGSKSKINDGQQKNNSNLLDFAVKLIENDLQKDSVFVKAKINEEEAKNAANKPYTQLLNKIEQIQKQHKENEANEKKYNRIYNRSNNNKNPGEQGPRSPYDCIKNNNNIYNLNNKNSFLPPLIKQQYQLHKDYFNSWQNEEKDAEKNLEMVQNNLNKDKITKVNVNKMSYDDYLEKIEKTVGNSLNTKLQDPIEELNENQHSKESENNDNKHCYISNNYYNRGIYSGTGNRNDNNMPRIGNVNSNIINSNINKETNYSPLPFSKYGDFEEAKNEGKKKQPQKTEAKESRKVDDKEDDKDSSKFIYVNPVVPDIYKARIIEPPFHVSIIPLVKPDVSKLTMPSSLLRPVKTTESEKVDKEGTVVEKEETVEEAIAKINDNYRNNLLLRSKNQKKQLEELMDQQRELHRQLPQPSSLNCGENRRMKNVQKDNGDGKGNKSLTTKRDLINEINAVAFDKKYYHNKEENKKNGEKTFYSFFDNISPVDKQRVLKNISERRAKEFDEAASKGFNSLTVNDAGDHEIDACGSIGEVGDATVGSVINVNVLHGVRGSVPEEGQDGHNGNNSGKNGPGDGLSVTIQPHPPPIHPTTDTLSQDQVVPPSPDLIEKLVKNNAITLEQLHELHQQQVQQLLLRHKGAQRVNINDFNQENQWMAIVAQQQRQEQLLDQLNQHLQRLAEQQQQWQKQLELQHLQFIQRQEMEQQRRQHQEQFLPQVQDRDQDLKIQDKTSYVQEQTQFKQLQRLQQMQKEQQEELRLLIQQHQFELRNLQNNFGDNLKGGFTEQDHEKLKKGEFFKPQTVENTAERDYEYQQQQFHQQLNQQLEQQYQPEQFKQRRLLEQQNQQQRVDQQQQQRQEQQREFDRQEYERRQMQIQQQQQQPYQQPATMLPPPQTPPKSPIYNQLPISLSPKLEQLLISSITHASVSQAGSTSPPRDHSYPTPSSSETASSLVSPKQKLQEEQQRELLELQEVQLQQYNELKRLRPQEQEEDLEENRQKLNALLENKTVQKQLLSDYQQELQKLLEEQQKHLSGKKSRKGTIGKGKGRENFVEDQLSYVNQIKEHFFSNPSEMMEEVAERDKVHNDKDEEKDRAPKSTPFYEPCTNPNLSARQKSMVELENFLDKAKEQKIQFKQKLQNREKRLSKMFDKCLNEPKANENDECDEVKKIKDKEENNEKDSHDGTNYNYLLANAFYDFCIDGLLSEIEVKKKKLEELEKIKVENDAEKEKRRRESERFALK